MQIEECKIKEGAILTFALCNFHFALRGGR